MRASRLVQFALGIVLAVAGKAAEPQADQAPHQVTWGNLFRSSTVTLYSENDKYFAGTDRHYTNGFKLSFLGDTNLQDSPDIVQAVAHYIPTLLYGHIQYNRTKAHALDHVFGHQKGRFAARDQGGGDDDIGFFYVFAYQLLLHFQEIF